MAAERGGKGEEGTPVGWTDCGGSRRSAGKKKSWAKWETLNKWPGPHGRGCWCLRGDKMFLFHPNRSGGGEQEESKKRSRNGGIWATEPVLPTCTHTHPNYGNAPIDIPSVYDRHSLDSF